VTIIGVEPDEHVETPAAGVELPSLPMAFDEFFTRHHAQLVRALGLALGDVEFGRDAAAEGFARAFERWSIVSTYANASGWVYRVGLNWARSGRRRLRRERLGIRLVDRPAADIAPRDAALLAALGQLSVDHRTVVVGRFYLDWSEAELADALDIAPGTVKSRLSRALTKLATLLEEPHG
jgi:RNA polymerase sigma-70 factor (ECF subfamily)